MSDSRLPPLAHAEDPRQDPPFVSPVEASAPADPPLTLFGEYSVASEKPYEAAGFLMRVGARLLDFGLHLGLTFLAAVVLMFLAGLVGALRGIPFDAMTTIFEHEGCASQLFGLLGAVAYQVVLTGWHGGSLGKRILGLVVLDESGTPCGPKQALRRELAYFIDALFFGMIAYSAMSKSPLQQRNGDSWAKTVVVFRRSAPQESLRSGLLLAGVAAMGSLSTMIVISIPYIFAIFRMSS